MKHLLFLGFYFISLIGNCQENTFICGTDDSELGKQASELFSKIQNNKAKILGPNDFYFCRVAVDIDSETFKKYNGDTVLIKHLVADQIEKASKIYENQIQTKLVLVNVNIWKDKSKDPYDNINVIQTMLTKLSSTYNTNSTLSKIGADVTVYLATKNFTGAGGLASGKYNVSPWNGINTLAHEIGHNFGSPHTQNCNWPGGAIDNCYAVEGNCYSQSLENINGSIMSYCNRRLFEFHPLCVTLMSSNAANRYLAIKAPNAAPLVYESISLDNYAHYSWEPVTLSEYYVLEISNTENFSTITAKDTAYQAFTNLVYLLPGSSNFLRIKSVNRSGQSTWSKTSLIKVPIDRPKTPQISDYAFVKTMVNLSGLKLKVDSLTEVTDYQFQWVNFSSSNTTFTFDNPTDSKFQKTNTFSPNTSTEAMAWRARAFKGDLSSAWSETQVLWFKPSSNAIDLVLPGLNGYPNSFPVNYFGSSGQLKDVNLTVSTDPLFSNKILEYKWVKSEFGNSSYPYILKDLQANTNYYLKYDEINNNSTPNLITMPKGLVRSVERTFKTGSEVKPETISYFNNSNLPLLGRNIRKTIFNDKYAFVLTNEGLVRIDLKSTQTSLFNKSNSAGNITNSIIEIKTDNQGYLWILTTVSKRLAFNGVFPKTTYRLAKLDPENMKILEEKDFFGGNNASFSSFDYNTKSLLTSSSIIHEIRGDSTRTELPILANSGSLPVQWSSKYAYGIFNVTGGNTPELRVYDIKQTTLKTISSAEMPIKTAVLQSYLDDSEKLWLIPSQNKLIYTYSVSDGFKTITHNFQNTPRIIGKAGEILYVTTVESNGRTVYSLKDTSFTKIGDLPYITGTPLLDKNGKIWILSSDRLLKFDPCLKNLTAPEISIEGNSKIESGQTINLKSKSCLKEVLWSESFLNGITNTYKTEKNDVLNLKPASDAVYKARCLVDNCLSESSTGLFVTIFGLNLVSSSKTKYCTNENLKVNYNSIGFENKIKVQLKNSNNEYFLDLNKEGLATLNKNVKAGKYWLKLVNIEPELISKDSINIEILETPTMSISGPMEVAIFDTAAIQINLTGKSPFNYSLNGKEYLENKASVTLKLVPKEPSQIQFNAVKFSDANCSNSDISSNYILKAIVKPVDINKWVLSFPNPFQEKLQFEVYNKPGVKLNVELIDIVGRTVLKKEFTINSFKETYTLDTKAVSSGSYFLKINTGKRQDTRRVLKL